MIQVGDLVHRGPDSAGVLALVDRYLGEQPDQWVQLVGNHEAQYLRPPAFEWPETISDDDAGLLVRWWSTGQMRVAAAVEAAGEHFLVTHAGLTEGFWERALDRLPAAEQTARALNSFIGEHDDVIFSAGEMLGGGAPNLLAGPVWASAAAELIPSWLESGRPLPFSQIHGHSRAMGWRGGRESGATGVAAVTTFDPQTAQETATLPGGRIVGIDPGHGRKPHRPWRAFVLSGDVSR